jgi:hypothetical protein
METGTKEQVEVRDPSFTEWIQCDSCSVARATWKIIGDSGELFLCGHHKTRHEAGLTRWAYEFFELDLKTSKS